MDGRIILTYFLTCLCDPVCMYSYIHTDMYSCMYVCTCVYVYGFKMYAGTHVRMTECGWRNDTDVPMCECTYVCMYVRTYVCIRVCMYVRMYACMYVCTCM